MERQEWPPDAHVLLMVGVYALETTVGSTCIFERVMIHCFPTYGQGPVRLKRPPAPSLQSLRVPLRRAVKEEAKLLRRIQRAVEAGETAKALGLQRLYLTSHSGKVATVAAVNRNLKSAQHARSNEIVAIAERISPFRACDEEVVVCAADKPSGGWRPITAYGLERAALQAMAVKAIGPFHQRDARQYALTGGGHNEAARQVRQGIADGYKWFVGLDISNFYGTIERRSISKIVPLPRRVIQNVIEPPHEHVRVSSVRRALSGVRLAEAAHSGISQGARSSPLIAELVVKEILAHHPGDVRIINVADDFGILARTKRDAIVLQSALTRSTERSPAGCFHLRPKANPRPRRVCDGFEFLGYRFRKRGARVLCQASDANIAKFNRRVIDLIIDVERKGCHMLKQLRRYIKAWWGSFPLMRVHLEPQDYFWGRHHVREVVRVNRPQAFGLVTLIVDWGLNDFAALPPVAELTEIIRTIRRRNPEHRSVWMTGDL